MTQSLLKFISNRKPVHGVGINDADCLTNPKINGKKVVCPYYRTWSSMLERCYCTKYQTKKPTYACCTVVTEWHSFVAFKAWMEAQDWIGKQLDKDLIKSGNKVYGPDTCIFVPPHVNTLLNTQAATRGDLPLGVRLNGDGFRATVRINTMSKALGTFPTPEEASAAYNTAKAQEIRRVASKQSDSRLRAALNRHARLYEKGEIQ